MFSEMKINPILKNINSSLIKLPSPSSLSMFWNFGSLLGVSLGLQIATGLFLAMHYTNEVSLAFYSVSHITRDVNYGWLLRNFHANGASMFFIMLYCHIARGMFFGSYNYTHTWLSGVLIILVVQGTAFLGYVLPWGQMSFWGATVITNLISSIPIFGNDIVMWLWGGFCVGNATLSRFFTLHFLMPFVLAALVLIHLMNLHTTGSNNPLGISNNVDKIQFHPYYTFKDLYGMFVFFTALSALALGAPYLLGDPENFIFANPLVTPIHIQPEWYFLFAYAILRTIPNKLGGVIALFLAIVILAIMPFMPKGNFRSLNYYPVSKAYYWFFCASVILLSWIGANPVEEPYITLGQYLSVLYFSYFFLNPFLINFWDSLLSPKPN